MKKFAALILGLIVSGFFAAGFAATKPVSAQVYNGIAKYKKANYTGCIQDMEAALKKNPNDILAKYYLALVYTRIGLKDEAKQYYQKVVDQNSEKVLVTYSKKALVCLDNPQSEGCANKDATADDDMSLFIKSGEFMHPELKKRIQERELKDVKNSFNSDKMPDLKDYRFINDASDEIPTDAQIAAAVKILAKVGYNPLASQTYNPMNNLMNPQMTQMNLMGANQNGSNNLVNLLPYLMAQNNNGANSNISPELIQTMLLNQSMGGFDFGSKN